MKEKLLYIDVCVLKVMAICMVVVSHYYRFFDTTSSLAGLKSIGFFGAALFAFLSGYLAELNSQKIFEGGYQWIIKKLYSVYLPYVIVNLISVFVYESDKNIFGQIFLGTNDDVLWYVPFILIFYGLFYVVTIKNGGSTKIWLVIGMLFIVMLELIGVDSPWYTSIGALVLGVIVAKTKVSNNRVIYIMINSALFLLSAVISIKCSEVKVVKDIFTIVSGMAFCSIMYNLMMVLRNKEPVKLGRLVSYVSTLTYFVYLMHMKVGTVLSRMGYLSILTFLLWSIFLSVFISVLYMKLIKLKRR